MKNSNKPAFQFTSEITNEIDKDGNKIYEMNYGLTKREYFAGLAMQGMLGNPNTGIVENGSRVVDPVGLVKGSLIFADELLKALENK